MPKAGESIPLSLQLFDGNTSKFVSAIVIDSTGTPLAGSPVLLTHKSDGRYEDGSLLMPTVAFVTVTYKVYNDLLLTDPSLDHSDGDDVFQLEVPDADILDKLCDILAQPKIRTDVAAIVFEDNAIVAGINTDNKLAASADGDNMIAASVETDTQIQTTIIDDPILVGVVEETRP